MHLISVTPTSSPLSVSRVKSCDAPQFNRGGPGHHASVIHTNHVVGFGAQQRHLIVASPTTVQLSRVHAHGTFVTRAPLVSESRVVLGFLLAAGYPRIEQQYLETLLVRRKRAHWKDGQDAQARSVLHLVGVRMAIRCCH